MTDENTVTRNDETSRYEITVADAVAGYAAFEVNDLNHVVMTHTVIDPDYKGQGLGSTLADEALADLARRGDVVVPQCPFIAHYLKGHEVAGLVVAWPDEADAAEAATPGESSA